MCRLNKRLPAIIARLLNSLLFWFWKRHFTLWVSVGWCAARSCAAKVFPSTWMLPSHTPEDRFSAKSRSDSHKLTTRAVDICFNSQGLAFWMCWSAFWRKAKFVSKVSVCQRATTAIQFNMDVQIWKSGCASLGPETRVTVAFSLCRPPSDYLARTCRRSCAQNLQPTHASAQCLGILREFRKCSKASLAWFCASCCGLLCQLYSPQHGSEHIHIEVGLHEVTRVAVPGPAWTGAHIWILPGDTLKSNSDVTTLSGRWHTPELENISCLSWVSHRTLFCFDSFPPDWNSLQDPSLCACNDFALSYRLISASCNLPSFQPCYYPVAADRKDAPATSDLGACLPLARSAPVRVRVRLCLVQRTAARVY